MGAVGGFVGPYLIGKLRERTGSFTLGLLVLAGSVACAVMIVAALRRAAVRRDEGG
jgi:ACS family tartrate transporter-like MFS transporter